MNLSLRIRLGVWAGAATLAAAVLTGFTAAAAVEPAEAVAPAPPAPPAPPTDKHWSSKGDRSGESIDERRPLKADARVHVSNVAGSIDISTWDKDEVYITGELGRGAEKLDISGTDRALEIVVRTPKNWHDGDGTDLHIQVPASIALSVDSVSADVVVQGVKGKVTAATVSGELTLSLGSDDVEARTVSGDVVLKSPTRVCTINTVSGDVRASGSSGKLKLETVSGDAQLQGDGFSDLALKSISGDFNIQGSLLADGKLVGETLSGELHVKLPATTSAMVTLHTFSGDVRSAFGNVAKSDDDHRERQEFKIGDGRARVDLSSFSGDIRLEKH